MWGTIEAETLFCTSLYKSSILYFYLFTTRDGNKMWKVQIESSIETNLAWHVFFQFIIQTSKSGQERVKYSYAYMVLYGNDVLA